MKSPRKLDPAFATTEDRRQIAAYPPQAMTERRRLDPSFATTTDIMEAADITRRTVTAWINLGLLPQPIKISLGSPGGVFNRFPMIALEQARFVASKRAEGLNLQQIADLLAAQGGPVARPAVRSRGAAPKPARSTRRRR